LPNPSQHPGDQVSKNGPHKYDVEIKAENSNIFCGNQQILSLPKFGCIVGIRLSEVKLINRTYKNQNNFWG
jgi:hypothetical protein